MGPKRKADTAPTTAPPPKKGRGPTKAKATKKPYNLFVDFAPVADEPVAGRTRGGVKGTTVERRARMLKQTGIKRLFSKIVNRVRGKYRKQLSAILNGKSIHEGILDEMYPEGRPEGEVLYSALSRADKAYLKTAVKTLGDNEILAAKQDICDHWATETDADKRRALGLLETDPVPVYTVDDEDGEQDEAGNGGDGDGKSGEESSKEPTGKAATVSKRGTKSSKTPALPKPTPPPSKRASKPGKLAPKVDAGSESQPAVPPAAVAAKKPAPARKAKARVATADPFAPEAFVTNVPDLSISERALDDVVCIDCIRSK